MRQRNRRDFVENLKEFTREERLRFLVRYLKRLALERERKEAILSRQEQPLSVPPTEVKMPL